MVPLFGGAEVGNTVVVKASERNGCMGNLTKMNAGLKCLNLSYKSRHQLLKCMSRIWKYPSDCFNGLLCVFFADFPCEDVEDASQP